MGLKKTYLIALFVFIVVLAILIMAFVWGIYQFDITALKIEV